MRHPHLRWTRQLQAVPKRRRHDSFAEGAVRKLLEQDPADQPVEHVKATHCGAIWNSQRFRRMPPSPATQPRSYSYKCSCIDEPVM